jgi:hypothetical protein
MRATTITVVVGTGLVVVVVVGAAVVVGAIVVVGEVVDDGSVSGVIEVLEPTEREEDPSVFGVFAPARSVRPPNMSPTATMIEVAMTFDF